MQHASSKSQAFLVTQKPEGHLFQEFWQKIADARLAGIACYVYGLDDGVYSLLKMQELREKGAHLFACAWALQERGMPMDEGTIPSGLVMLHDLIAKTDGFTVWDSRPNLISCIFNSEQPILIVADKPEKSSEALRVAEGLNQVGDVQMIVLNPKDLNFFLSPLKEASFPIFIPKEKNFLSEAFEFQSITRVELQQWLNDPKRVSICF